MKKLLVLFAGLTCHSLHASPVLSPNAAAVHTDGVFFCDECSGYSLRAGFRGDYVFDRKLTLTADQSIMITSTTSIMSNEGVLTFNLWDRLDIYGLVGAANSSNSGVYSVPPLSPFLVGAESAQTIWGVGARATLLEYNFGCCGTSYVGADINYESIGSSNTNNVTINHAPVPSTSPIAVNSVNYKELQVSLQVGHKIAMLTPYIAAKWSNAGYGISDRIGNRYLRNTGNHWGYAVGVLLIDAGRMSVTAEARFIDEKAMTIMGEFRF